jgi:hypothetical protein
MNTCPASLSTIYFVFSYTNYGLRVLHDDAAEFRKLLRLNNHVEILETPPPNFEVVDTTLLTHLILIGLASAKRALHSHGEHAQRLLEIVLAKAEL